MGKSDVYQFDYLDDNERFADQVNGALFQGRQVVKPDELEPVDMQSVYLGKEAGGRREFQAVVDKARMWRRRLLHILAVENVCGLPYGAAKYVVGEPQLSEAVEAEEACP